MDSSHTYSLAVGEAAKVRPGHFRASVSVIFAGMVSESIFSIVVQWSFGYNSLAYNLFLSTSQTEVHIPKGRLEIIEVTQDRLKLIHRN